jgi:hypothetical protein
MFITNMLIAQSNKSSLSGTVIDSLSGKPLPNATVTLKNADKLAAKVTTNTKGAFSINDVKAGSYTLVIDYLGYKSFTKPQIAVDGSNPYTFDASLTLQDMLLNDVKVTAKVSKPFIVFSGGKITLNLAQSPLTAGSDVYSVLLRAPGVVDLNGSLIFRNKSVNVLIDGKPTHLSDDELRNMLSSLPANGIDRIEILPNPSAKYDASAGSVINIIMAKSKRDGLNGNFTTGVGSGKYFRYNEDLSLNFHSGALSIYGSYDYMHNKQYYDNKNEQIVDPQTSIFQRNYEVRTRSNNSYQFGLDYDLSKKSTLGAHFRGYTNYGKRAVTNNSALLHSTNTDTTSVANTNGKVKFSNPAVNVSFDTKIDSLGQTLSINADYLEFNKSWNDDIVTNYFAAGGQEYLPAYNLRSNLPSGVKNYSFSVDYTQPSSIGKFEYGLRSQFTNTDNDAQWQTLTNNQWINDTTKSNRFKYKENIYAGYINYTKTFNLKYTVTLGLRAEQTETTGDLVTTGQVNNRNYFNLFPNVNLEYAENTNSVFNLNYRRSIDRFGLSVVNPFLIYQNQYAYSQGNPTIRPQINNNYEFTYTFKKAFILGTSYTHTVNAVVPVYLKGNNDIVISTFDNLKYADLFYVYYDLTFPITKWWTTDMSGGTGFLKYNTSSSAYSGKNATWSYLLQTENTFHFGKGWNAEFNVLDRGPYASGIYKLETIFTTSTGVSKSFANNNASIKLSFLDIFNTEKQKIHIDYKDLILNQDNKTETQFVNLTFTYKFGNKNLKSKPANQPKTADTERRLNN